jgi:pyrroloquinoline quinone (PQQ) biosynthesis protein C
LASINDKVHEKIAAGLADTRVSPAALAVKMTREPKAVNEAMLGYLVNYIIVMAEQKVIPMQLAEVQQTCKELKLSLEELGLTGVTRPLDQNEYLVV